MTNWLLIVIGLQVPPTMVMTTYEQCVAVVLIVETQAKQLRTNRRAICVGPKGEIVTEVQLRGRPA